MELIANVCRGVASAVWGAMVSATARLPWSAGATVVPLDSGWQLLLVPDAPDGRCLSDWDVMHRWWDSLPETSVSVLTSVPPDGGDEASCWDLSGHYSPSSF